MSLIRISIPHSETCAAIDAAAKLLEATKACTAKAPELAPRYAEVESQIENAIAELKAAQSKMMNLSSNPL